MVGDVLYIDNDNYLLIEGLQNQQTEVYLDSGATVDVTLQDPDGNNVSGQTWPTTMNYVASSLGNFDANLENTLTLTKGVIYSAVIDIDDGSGGIGKIYKPLRALERRI